MPVVAPVEADRDLTPDPGGTAVSTLLDLQEPDTEDTAVADCHEVLAVRAWARSRGYPIDETSGVPLLVLRTYRRLHRA